MSKESKDKEATKTTMGTERELFMLLHGTRMMQTNAARSLGKQGRTAIAPLLVKLNKCGSSGRKKIGKIFGQDADAQRLLLGVFMDDLYGKGSSWTAGTPYGNMDFRIPDKMELAAVETLGYTQQPQLIPLLLENIIKNENRYHLRHTAAVAIRRLSPTLDPKLEAWCLVSEEKWTGAAKMGVVAIEPLIFAMNRFDNRLQPNAVNSLILIKDPRATDALIHRLESDYGRSKDLGTIIEIHKNVWEAIIKELGIRKERRAVDILKKYYLGLHSSWLPSCKEVAGITKKALENLGIAI